MIWWLLGAHGVGIIAAALVGNRGIRTSLRVGAIAPAITTIWAVTALADYDNSDQATSELAWVEGLDLTFLFRADGLALMMTLLVSGIGTLVFINATGYFSADATGGARFAASLLGFSASMLGLVLADSIWTLFIFWELTSITSFLLVGFKHEKGEVSDAARRALMITGTGGLALLAGLIILAIEGGTANITELAGRSSELSGTSAAVAAALILIGAATKSAQFPFHVWLPGAMAAPTPVSAYLHSATMVKAGIFLIAVLGPAFTDIATWKVLGMAFGIASMLWGAVGALRHRDAKLILAWGTISQLGLLTTLLSVGSAKAIFAAISILLAHALFKAALFLVVGEIDIRTGTRDIAELGGLYRSMPVAFFTATAGVLSMAGLPPLLGFSAKEAAVEAVLGLDGFEAVVAIGAVVFGSSLTVAYSTRFLITVFGPGPDVQPAPRRLTMTVPSLLLASAGIVGYAVIGPINTLVGRAATEVNPSAEVYSLYRWPGITTALLVSTGVVASGLVIGWFLAMRDSGAAPAALGAKLADQLIDGTLVGARKVVVRVQHGSLPAYLVTMAAAATLATLPFLTELSTDGLVWWDNLLQVPLALAIVGAALAGAFVGSRLGAALCLGAVGVGVAGMFAVAGAPDLVLTQLLVETIIVVGFVVGLGHLRRIFPAISMTWRMARLAIAGLMGLAVSLSLAASASRPTGQPPIEALTESAVDEGGGNNVVNVILTDIRALDTLGEVVVLAVVAIGVLALAAAGRTDEKVEEGQTPYADAGVEPT